MTQRTQHTRRWWWVIAALPGAWITLPLAGCAPGPASAQRSRVEARDPARAEALTRKAADRIESDPVAAERLLRDALAADPFHGPAHNNLGVIALRAGALSDAAAAFERARTLLPGHPDPRLNLGLALERGGRIDAALDAYRAALSVVPDHLPAIQALARCQLRHNRADTETLALLAAIELRADPAWRAWASDQRLRLAGARQTDRDSPAQPPFFDPPTATGQVTQPEKPNKNQ